MKDFSFRGVVCSVCQTIEEERKFSQLLRLHKYGHGAGFLHFVGYEGNQITVAGMVDADNSFNTSRAASTALDRFDFIRKYLLIVRRVSVVDCPTVAKIRRQRAILRFAAIAAQAYTTEQLLILAGNSHEAQPAAVEEGWQCEVPMDPRQALFYWIPLRGFAEREKKSKRQLYDDIGRYRTDKQRTEDGLRQQL